MIKAELQSPCIRYCELHDDTCMGCFRTINDIGLWRSYDKQRRIEETKKFILQRKKIMKIFIDMDGVLADFDKYICKTLKFGTKEEWNNRWDLVPQTIFKDIEPLPDAHELMSYVEHLDNKFILTAIPKNAVIEQARRDKFMWLKKYFGIDPWQVCVVYRDEKMLFATETVYNAPTPNVLIDDYEKNVDDWERVGGAGILHINTKATITKLNQLGF